MERKRGGGLKRKVSLLLAVLLIVTGIPMDTVYAAADNGKEVILDENEEIKDDVDVEAANAEDQNKEEEPLAESTEEKEDNTEVVGEKTEEGGNEETQEPAEEAVETHTATVPEDIDEVAVTVYVKDEAGEYVAYEEKAIEVGTEIWLALDMEAEEFPYITVNGTEVTTIEVDEAEVLCYNIEVEEDFDVELEANYDEVADEALQSGASITVSTDIASYSGALSKADNKLVVAAKVDGKDAITWEYDADGKDLVFTLSNVPNINSLDIKVKWDADKSSHDPTDLVEDTTYDSTDTNSSKDTSNSDYYIVSDSQAKTVTITVYHDGEKFGSLDTSTGKIYLEIIDKVTIGNDTLNPSTGGRVSVTKPDKNWDGNSDLVYTLTGTALDLDYEKIVVKYGNTELTDERITTAANEDKTEIKVTIPSAVLDAEAKKATASGAVTVEVTDLYDVEVALADSVNGVTLGTATVVDSATKQITEKFEPNTKVTITVPGSASENNTAIDPSTVTFDSSNATNNSDGTYTAEITVGTGNYTKNVSTVNVSAEAKATKTVSVVLAENADGYNNANIEKISFEPVKFIPGVDNTVNISGTITPKAAFDISDVSYYTTDSSTTIKLTGSGTTWNISGYSTGSDDITLYLVVTTDERTPADISEFADVAITDVSTEAVTVTGYTKIAESNFAIYKSTDNGDTYHKYDGATYVGDMLAVALVDEIDGVGLNVSAVNSSTNDSSITVTAKTIDGKNYYTFTAEADNTFTITAKLNKDLVVFSKGDYTVVLSDKDETKVKTSYAETVYPMDSNAAGQGFTIKPSTGYKLYKVDDSVVQDPESYTLTSLTFESGKVKTITVQTTDGYTATIDLDDNIDGVYTALKSDKSDVDSNTKVTGNVLIEKDTVLYFKLKDSTYQLNSILVTNTTDKKTQELVSTATMAFGGSPNKATVYQVKVTLTGDSTITANAILKEGYKVEFKGDNYTAYVVAKDAQPDSSKDTKYSKDLAFVDDLNAAKDIILVADEGYRFTDVEFDNSLKTTYAVGGEKVTISNVSSANFDKLDAENKLSVKALTASLEKTVKLSIPTATGIASVKVIENGYSYHAGTNKDEVKADVNGTDYKVKAGNKIDVQITLTDATTTKVSYAGFKLKNAKKDTDITASLTVDDNGVFALSDLELTADSVLTLKVDQDEEKLAGIYFTKGNYSVKDSNKKDLITVNSFIAADGTVNSSVLKLFEGVDVTNTTAKLKLTVEPVQGYTISKINYAGGLCYSSEADAELDYKYSANNSTNKSVTLEIPYSALKKGGEQETLQVVTEAEGLNSADSFTISYAQDEAYFEAKTELEFTVSDGKNERDTTGSFNVAEGAKYLTFDITAKYDSVEPVLNFLDGSGNAVNILTEGSSGKIKVSAEALSKNGVETIEVDGKISTKDISFTYNNNLVSVNLESNYTGTDSYLRNRLPYTNKPTPVDAVDENGVELKDGTKVVTYSVRTGEEVKIDVAVKGTPDGKGGISRYYATLTKVGTYDFDEHSASIDLAATTDQSIEIKATATTAKVLQVASGDVVDAQEDGSYVISYKTDYEAFFYEGHALATVDAVKFTVDGKERTISNDKLVKNKVTFTVYQADAGKTANLKLLFNDTNEAGQEEEKEVASFDFVIAETLTADGLAVDGVKDGVLTQTVDTKKEYEITIPEGTSIQDLTPYSSTADMRVSIEDGKLVVTTPATAATNGVGTISLKNNKVSKTLLSFTVNTTEVAGLEDAVLKVVPLSSTNSALKMQLSASGVADVDLVKGDIAYKVKVTKQSTSTKPYYDTFYVRKDKDSEITYATLQLLEHDTDEVSKQQKYNVEVCLVRLNDKASNASAGSIAGKGNITDKNEIIKSKDVVKFDGTDDFVLNVPYYTNAEELVLNNQVNTVYRGQTKVVLADVDFGANTTYVDGATVTLYDANGVEANNKYGKTVYTGEVAYNKLFLTLSSKIDLGNYTVKVTAKAPANTVAATASMSIKVEEGIWSFELQNVPDTLMKVDKKAASFKASVLFNDGNTSGIKNKKVVWSIENTTDYLTGMVTVKNGTVTVNKNFVLSSNVKNNTFTLVATSEADSTIRDSKDIVITANAVEFGDFVLVEKVNGKFVKLDQTTISSDLAYGDNLYIIEVKKSVSNNKTFELKDILNSSFTVKASNKKLAITEEFLGNENGVDVYGYNLKATSVLKNVSLTFTALDGSKKSVKKVFNIDYADMSNMVLRVAGTDIKNGSYKFAGTSEDTLFVELGTGSGDDFTNFKGLLNTQVSISGGKILSSDTLENTYIIKLTKESATFTVKNKGDKTATPLTCVITNTAYAGFSKTAAPAVVASEKQLAAYSVNEQNMTYTFKKAASYKFVKVQIDTADELKLVKKKANIYGTFRDATGMTTLGQDYMIYPIVDGAFTLNFAKDNELSAGAYKLFFSYGDYDTDGNFIPATKAGKVTIKAVASKSVEYNVDGNYTMSLLDTASVALTGTAAKGSKDVQVQYLEAMSTVVNGDGNMFSKFFTVKDNQLALQSYEMLNTKISDNSNKTYVSLLESLVGDNGAADLTGYVTYRVNGSSMEQQAKVTVSLSKEALKKYSANAVTMLAGKGVNIPVEVSANNSAITVKDAYVSTTGSSFKANAVGSDGALSLSTSSKPSVGSNTVTVNVIPESSFYVKDATKSTGTAAKAHGVAVDVTVDAKSTADPVITIDDMNVIFDSYDGAGNYVATIPYTNHIANVISSAIPTDKTLKGKVVFTAGEDGESIKVTVAKSVLDDGKLVSYGDSKDIEVTVKFCDSVEKTYTFNVKFPSRNTLSTDKYQTIFTEIRKAVWKDVEDGDDAYVFPTAVDFSEANALKAEADKLTADKKADEATIKYAAATNAYISAAEKAVKAAVEKQFVMGANIAIATKDGVKGTLATVTGNTANGTVKVALTLTGTDVTSEYVQDGENLTGNNYTIKTSVNFTVAEDLLDVYYKKLDTFATNFLADAYKDEKVLPNNDLTEEKLLSLAREVVLKDADSAYRLVVDKGADNEGAWNMTKATSSKKGEFSITLKVVNMYNPNAAVKTVTISDEIGRLSNVNDALDAFKAYYQLLRDAKLTGFDFTSLNAATESSDIEKLAEKAIEDCGNSNIHYAFVDDHAFEQKVDDNTKEAIGVTGRLVFTEEINGVLVTSDDYADLNASFTGRSMEKDDLIKAVDGVIGDAAKNADIQALLTNKEETTYQNLFAAATTAIKNAPYKIELTITEYVAPTSKTAGKVTYKVAFVRVDGGDGFDDVLTYVQNIDAKPAYQSFEEAANAITQGFVQTSEATAYSRWFNNGEIDYVALLAYIKAFVDNKGLEVKYNKVVNKYFTAYEDACAYTPADVNNEGMLSVYVKLTDNNDSTKSEVITLNKTFDVLAQDATAASAIVNNLGSYKAVTDIITSTVTSDEISDAIYTLIKQSAYNLSVSSVTFDTSKKEASFTVTLTQTDGTPLVNARPYNLTYTN